MTSWTPQQVVTLAPDASSAKAGRELAELRKWLRPGRNEQLIWGEHQGSGATPYQTLVDLDTPLFHCSCPSRKQPCKHALGLLLLFAQQPNDITRQEAPVWVQEWLAARSRRAQQRAAKAEPAAIPTGERQPAQTQRANAREAKVAAGLADIRRWLDDLVRQGVAHAQNQPYSFWANPARQAILGSLNRASRTRRPKPNAIDWPRTIRANLQHYQADYRTVIPAQLIGFGRRRASLRDIILCIDQSGSMASSVVYASVFGAVLASLRAIQTRMVVFDTSVVDLTEQLDDPVDLLFGVQLGGGTDIHRALSYCQTLIRQPESTIVVLISDLYEGGNRAEMLKRANAIVTAGAQMVALLALDDRGAPAYDHANAAALAQFGIPAFACTPDLFPELMAAAINRQDIGQWAAQHELVVAR